MAYSSPDYTAQQNGPKMVGEGMRRRPASHDDILRERSARAMLRLIVVIVALAVGLTLAARLSGYGTSEALQGEIAAQTQIVISLKDNGQIIVSDATSDEALLTYSDGRGGFFRSVLRAFSLKRRAYNIPDAAPFAVTRWDNGRLTLNDPQTGHEIPVDSFGQSVTEIFASIVTQDKT